MTRKKARGPGPGEGPPPGAGSGEIGAPPPMTDRFRTYARIGIVAMAALIVAGVLVAISLEGGESGEIVGAEEVETELAGLPQQGAILGSADADVTVIEFADLQCPACADYSQTVIPTLIEKVVEPGHANIEFRNFVILGPGSEEAARAALAAGEQDRLWHFVSVFYRNQGIEGSGYVTDDFLTDVAEAAGVPDIDAWQEARGDPRWIGRIQEGQSSALDAGIRSTPTILVEGPEGSETIDAPADAAQVEAAVHRMSGE
jgi:protein-disulfide isomerase